MVRKPCCDKEGLKKGPWTSEEDQKLIDYIHEHGPGNWRTLPKKAGLQRCGKSCRLRWTNYLRPDIKRGRFSFDEEETIIQLHSIMGNKWSAIAAKLPGRTDNEIKNYFNTHIRKRLLRMGIDPVTHGPRLDYLDFPSILSTLQTSSLLNFPNVLLNLQNLINNQEILKLATSLTSSSLQNEIIPNFVTQNQTLSNNYTLVNSSYDVNAQIIVDQIQPITQNVQSLNGLLSSSTDTNNSGFVSNNSTHSSSALYPLDSGYRYLDNNIMSNEDEIVDSYFMINDVQKKLESPFINCS